MRGWKHGYMFLAAQESRDCFDFISGVRIRGIYLSPALGTAKLQLIRLIMLFLFFLSFVFEEKTHVGF